MNIVRNIKTIAVLWLLFCFNIDCYSQMAPMKNQGAFMKRLEENALSIKSIESNFEQVKHLDIFNDDVHSKGIFYYQATDKIAMNYTAPVRYSMVINGDILKTDSNGRTNTVSLGNNKMMKELRKMISACMTGDISELTKDYKTEYFEDDSNYLVTLKPESASIKAYITGFRIYFDKEDMSVKRLKIEEGTADYTEYRFSGQKLNIAIESHIFE